jgi:hypothetical protein
MAGDLSPDFFVSYFLTTLPGVSVKRSLFIYYRSGPPRGSAIQKDLYLRAPLKIHFPLRPAAKSTALRCAHSPNLIGFDSLARLAQRLLARSRTKTEYLEVPLTITTMQRHQHLPPFAKKWLGINARVPLSPDNLKSDIKPVWPGIYPRNPSRACPSNEALSATNDPLQLRTR